MSKLKTDVNKVLKKVLSNYSNPHVVTIYLANEFGAWVDINVFKKVLENNSLVTVVKFKKLIKEISTSVYNEVSKQFDGGVIEISKVENLEGIINKHTENLTNETVKNLIKVIF